MGLIAALVVGQVLARVEESLIEPRHPFGQFPVVAAAALVVGLVLAGLVVLLRVQLGNELAAAARTRAISLPTPESLPPRYSVTDPSGMLVSAGLAALDLALLLLVQASLRAPIAPLAQDYVEPSTADAAYVLLVLALALVVLVKLYRAAGPVLMLLVWWGLDRVVPTAGFMGARPVAAVRPATTRILTSTPRPALVKNASVVSQRTPRPDGGATVVSERVARGDDATVVAQPAPHGDVTVVSERLAPDEEATVVGQHGAASGGDATIVSERPTTGAEDATIVSQHTTPGDDATVVAQEPRSDS